MLFFALGQLRWSPQAVWAASPREIAAAMGAGLASAPLGRADLAALMDAFPDP